MKNLLLKDKAHRINFKKIEEQYLSLKFIVHNQNITNDLRWEASLLLSKLLKNNSRVFLKNRCFLTGRARGYLRFFNLSRIQIRDLARNNDLSFIKKLSW